MEKQAPKAPHGLICNDSIRKDKKRLVHRIGPKYCSPWSKTITKNNSNKIKAR